MRTLTIVFLGLLLAVSAFADEKAAVIPPADVVPNIGPVAQSPPTDDMWDLLSWAPSPFADLFGCEFAGGYFYVTADPGYEPNMVYIFDRVGNFIGQFEQWSSPGWGWRDLVYDGTYLYGCDDGTLIHAFDLDGNPVPSMNINGPISCCRALAYDPFLDHFWTQNFNGLLYEFGRDGTVYWSGTSGAAAAGAAFDNGAPDGPWLWIFSQTGMPPTTFHKFDPVNHVPTGFVYQLQLLPGLMDQFAGGAFFTEEWNPAYWVMGGTVQGTPYGGFFLLEMYPNMSDTFDVTIDLTYISGSPVPPGGGPINYDVQVTNNETDPVTFDAWIAVTIPSGAEITLINRELIMPGGGSAMRNLTLNVPAGAPEGTYILTGYTGDYPDIVWHDSSFTFEKSASGNGLFDPAMLTVSGWDEPWDVISGAVIPNEFALLDNYPNPFNQTTTIRFSLPEAANVTLTVYDIDGRRVAELVNCWRDAGVHEAVFDAANLSSGVYIYRLTSGSFTMSSKMVLMK